MPKTKQAVEQAAKLKLYLPQLDKLEERLLEWTAKDRFQAIVVKATRYGVPIFEGCYGTSTNEYGVHLDTIFSVASNTKTIIAALIMILLEDGRLELNDRINWHYPKFDGGGRHQISIWHLLTHTSGIVEEELDKNIAEYIKENFDIDPPGDNSTHDEWEQYTLKIKQALKLPDDYDNHKVWENASLLPELKHQPRELMSYCSYGYEILKEAICAITGESIDSYAQRVLFGSLGMTDSYWKLPKEKWGKVLGRNARCVGYGWINSEKNYTNESGGGGLKTTVNDMSNFCEMILNDGTYNGNRILSPASIRQISTNYNADFANSWDAWSLGWNYRGTKVDDGGVLRTPTSLEHGGWAGHKILIDREYGLSVITYMGEYDGGVFLDLGRIPNMIIAALG
ncbi:MAG: beta-lactamase family protein [Oscillospiraceae bacterium]|nr:beta-lactamase family protein [Oscillospiraceae bacterium]